MTEVFFRNPHNYVRELAEVGGPFRIAWDRGILIKKRIEPVQHAKLYFGPQAEVDILCIGPQGTAHLNLEHDWDNPLAVYPTWEYGEDFNILEEMVSSPIGTDVDACTADLPSDQKPVLGQPHRVVVTNLPTANLSANRPFYRHLRELQEEYPDCNIMLHGLYSYRVMFGMGFGSADVEPRTAAANGKVYLPIGKEVAYARTVGQMQWVNMMNMSITDLKEPRMRCIFNIKSAQWAGQYFEESTRVKTRGNVIPDTTSPRTILPTVSTGFKANQNLVAQEGDKIVCDSCSLAETCKEYREGAVCSVKGSETGVLAKMFQSRSSDKILDGLGAILGAQVNRLERGMESEEEFGELDPEVSKLMNSVFANGVKLAKLVDPTLTKPLVQINNSSAVAGASPKELGAAVIRELESQGIRREDITPAMFEQMLLQMTGGPREAAIEGGVVNG